jgi:broad specificity phosphatase PhoE
VPDADVCIVQHGAKAPERGDPGLTAAGRSHARTTGRFLATRHWDALYCSPLRRAHETAQLIGDCCSLVPSLDDRLRERMNFGDGTRPYDAAGFRDDWARATLDRTWVPPVGDSSASAGTRMHAAIEQYVAQKDKDILVVSHGGATTDLLRTLFGDATVRSVAPVIIDGGIESCALTRLRLTDRGWQLAGVFSRTHLES